jgi:hypothetical protein
LVGTDWFQSGQKNVELQTGLACCLAELYLLYIGCRTDGVVGGDDDKKYSSIGSSKGSFLFAQGEKAFN